MTPHRGMKPTVIDPAANSAPSAGKRRLVMPRQHGEMTAHGWIAEVLLQVPARLSPWFRKKRMAQFELRFSADAYPEIIDVGGTFEFWEGTPRRVTIVNPWVPAERRGSVTSIEADGRQVPFPDGRFAMAFSNSVIEHMSCREDMAKFAQEVRRVGREVYCQTPNRWFPFDVHYLAFFWHWWPKTLRNYFVVRYLTGWGWVFRPDREAVLDWAQHVNLVGKKEFQALFPDCAIEEEKFLGMTKSFIAIRSLAPVGKPGPHARDHEPG